MANAGKNVIAAADVVASVVNIFLFFYMSPSFYFKQRGLGIVLEAGGTADESCSYCTFSSSYGAVVIHERRAHCYRLPYLPTRNPRVGLSLNVMDWKAAVTCAFCSQLFLPGQALSQCMEGM